MKVMVHLNKELAKKYGRRAFSVRSGDKVKVLRGSFRGSVGKIERIDRKNSRLFIEGVEREKADGSKVRVPVHASNCVLIDLDLSDKKRKEKLGDRSASKES